MKKKETLSIGDCSCESGELGLPCEEMPNKNKPGKKKNKDEMLPSYDFSKGVRGKYAGQKITSVGPISKKRPNKTKRPKLPPEWEGPYTKHETVDGWVIEGKMGLIILDRRTKQEAEILLFAMNEAYV